MGWVSFQVVRASGGNLVDGQCDFTFVLSNNNTTLNSGAQLQYSPSETTPPPPVSIRTVFTTSAAINLANGVFSLPNVTLANSIHIPLKGTFTGGNYNVLGSLTFDPSTDLISGIFSSTGADDPCTWQATDSGTKEPGESAKEAAY